VLPHIDSLVLVEVPENATLDVFNIPNSQ